MGYQERDYYREDTGEDGFQIKTWTVRLIIANCAIFLADLLTTTGGHSLLLPYLELHGDTIVSPWRWYQFLTYGFLHNPESLWHLVGNMFGLWVFGRALEERFGGKEFLRYYLIAIVLGGIVWSARQYFLVGSYLNWAEPSRMVCMGASGGIAALIVLYCLLYPRNTVLLFFAIPLPAWMFGVLVEASDLTGSWAAHSTPAGMARAAIAFDVHLAGAALALAYWSLGLNFGRFPGWRELSLGWSRIKSLLRARPAVRIHDEMEDDEELELQADRLLEKIARQGEASLTPHERRVLETYSRRIRDKQR